MNRYCGRFAPTPSGPLHFGSMIAAIASYCDARANDGTWHVRIDDIDGPRIVAGAAEDILRTLTAYGLEWDGKLVYQSRNSDSYHAAIHLLRSRAQVFACSCSRKDINEAADTGMVHPLYPAHTRNQPRYVGQSKRRTVATENSFVFRTVLGAARLGLSHLHQ